MPETQLFSIAAKLSLATTGVIVFPLLHCFCRLLLEFRWPWMSNGISFRISTRVVSGMQSLVAICIATRTVWVCKDILRDKDSLLHGYAWFALCYFPYDVLAMYIGHPSTHKILQEDKTPKAYLSSFLVFFRKECLIVMHHLVLLAFFPIIEFNAKGLGDYLVGCFFLAEISTPFYSLKGIFRELGINSGLKYELNGLVFMLTFFVGRVMSVPLMFLKYSKFANIPILQVPQKIPLKCSFVCLLFFLLQCYWFSMIWYIIVKHLRKKRTAEKER